VGPQSREHGQGLAAAPRAEGSEPTCVRLSIAHCPHGSENNFLTITACKNTVDQHGNPKTETKDLARHLVLEPQHVEALGQIVLQEDAARQAAKLASESTPIEKDVASAV
jgi:hypothetical protein